MMLRKPCEEKLVGMVYAFTRYGTVKRATIPLLQESGLEEIMTGYFLKSTGTLSNTLRRPPMMPFFFAAFSSTAL